jgi:hypothetical protein
LEDQEIAGHQDQHANQARDPVDTMSSRPAKHEVSCGQKNDADECRNKPMLGRPQTILLDVWDEVLELVDQKAGNSDQTGDTNSYEAETCFAEVEVVDWRVNQFKDFEEGIVDSIS